MTTCQKSQSCTWRYPQCPRSNVLFRFQIKVTECDGKSSSFVIGIEDSALFQGLGLTALFLQRQVKTECFTVAYQYVYTLFVCLIVL